MIDEKFIEKAAALAGVKIPAARLPAVLGNLQRTAEVAASLDEVVLDPATDELAPVWRP